MAGKRSGAAGLHDCTTTGPKAGRQARRQAIRGGAKREREGGEGDVTVVSAAPHPPSLPLWLSPSPHAHFLHGHHTTAHHHPRAIRMVFFWFAPFLFVSQPFVCFGPPSKFWADVTSQPRSGYSQTPGKHAREPMGVKYLGVFCPSSGCWLDVARPARIRLAHKKHPPPITTPALLLCSTKKRLR